MIVFLAVVYGAPVHAMPIYWNVFNKEGESALGADLVTYASLADMLGDTNRTSVNSTHVNIVGSGATLLGGTGPNPIPEPSTIFLLGSGLAGLATWRYRKTGKA